MEAKDYLSRAQSALIRIETVLDHRIGEIYNNESLIMTNESLKANASVRLYQTRGYDSGLSSIMFQDSDGGFYPLEIKLIEIYGLIDYSMVESKRSDPLKEFLKSDANVSAEIKTKVLSLFKDAETESLHRFSGLSSSLERIAYKYHMLMRRDSGYPLLPILARLDLYSSLIKAEPRFAGANIEEAMLIRREEHDESIAEESHERLTLFISECLLDAITRAADQIAEMRHISEYAVLFLSMKMERGKEYTFDELSLLFSLDKELMKNLFVIPALSSDRISIGSTASGEDTITLIG